MANPKRTSLVLLIVPLLIGLAGLFRVAQTPQFALYRTVDVVQLLGSGVCFGVTMAGFFMLLRRTKS